MNKAELRLKYKALRKQLSAEEREDLSMAIANQLLQLSIWGHSFYHVFLSITELKEINTDYILHILQGKDKNVVVSKCHFKDRSMSHYLLSDNTQIKKSAFGIPEPIDGLEVAPEKIDVVFIPLLAFDEKGNRVGYGKGYYDRFLHLCKTTTLKIGLSFFDAETRLIQDTTEHDVPLDFCVTPTKVYSNFTRQPS